MSDETTFEGMPKIARWSREIVVTEKIDGTNAQVFVGEDGTIKAGSKNQWLEPFKGDNFGFGRWVHEHADELRTLGPGRHFGEWWGSGIQRGYGLAEKRFSLFNVHRWADGGKDVRPACCGVVPVLYRGPNDEVAINMALAALRTNGSFAAPCFSNPEGIVIFHTAGGFLFKKTLEKDEETKGGWPNGGRHPAVNRERESAHSGSNPEPPTIAWRL